MLTTSSLLRISIRDHQQQSYTLDVHPTFGHGEIAHRYYVHTLTKMTIYFQTDLDDPRSLWQQWSHQKVKSLFFITLIPRQQLVH